MNTFREHFIEILLTVMFLLCAALGFWATHFGNNYAEASKWFFNQATGFGGALLLKMTSGSKSQDQAPKPGA